jgi:TRAP-type transport system small permease protein
MDSQEARPGAFRKAEGLLVKAIGTIVALLLAGMVLLVFMNVIFRYFLNSAIAWSEEISRFMMIWLCFLGSVLAFQKNEHLGLDMLVKVLPARLSRLAVVIADILVLAATGCIFAGGFWMAQDSLASGWTSPATSTPYGLVYLVVPLAAGFLFLQGLLKLAENLRALVRRA